MFPHSPSCAPPNPTLICIYLVPPSRTLFSWSTFLPGERCHSFLLITTKFILLKTSFQLFCFLRKTQLFFPLSSGNLEPTNSPWNILHHASNINSSLDGVLFRNGHLLTPFFPWKVASNQMAAMPVMRLTQGAKLNLMCDPSPTVYTVLLQHNAAQSI